MVHPIQVIIIDMANRKFIFHIPKYFTFNQLKALYSQKVSLPDNEEYIYKYKGKQFKPDNSSSTIKELGITDSSTIYVVGRVHGGKTHSHQ